MRQRRTLITGANGQLSRALQRRLHGIDLVATLGRPDVDLTDWRAVRERIATEQPNLVIHAAAQTDVDGCEREPESAWTLNAVATRYIAHAATQVGARFVYVSTNYVFDGSKTEPYHEFDQPNPINIYGSSKLAGEREALGAAPTAIVARTAWLYSAEGRNFLLTMRRLMAERGRLTVVADQHGNPTLADDLASAILALVDRAPGGVYHVTNSGVASWFEWATAIAEMTGATTEIVPIPGAEYQRAAAPPVNGAMTSLLLPGLGIALPGWSDALARCLGS